MIRRGVGALLVLSLTAADAPPVSAQQPPPGPRLERKWVWTIIGAAAGALVGGAASFHYHDPLPYPYYWSNRRRMIASGAFGAAVGAGIGFALERTLARRGGVGRGPGGPYFVVVAEGLTSATITDGIRVAPRAFTASQLVEACRDPRVVDRLEVAPNPLEMREDGRYALNSLSVVAVNGADVAMAGVPIVLEAEEVNPPVVQLRSDDPDLNVGRLHAVRTGFFQMRIRTMCGAPHAERIILGRVTP